MRILASIAILFATTGAFSQGPDRPSNILLPDAPSQLLLAEMTPLAETSPAPVYSSSLNPHEFVFDPADFDPQTSAAQAAKDSDKPRKIGETVFLDSNGNPIPLERHQPTRILGFMPNFRTVSGGSTPPPPGWKYNFKVATHQAFDYSSFVFLGLTSLSAEAINSHPALGKGIGGLYAYTWRGLLDKTDGTYLSAWFLPSLLHEDTRYYALGHGHTITARTLYVISRQAVARTYGGHDTPNFAGLGGKVLTQVVSREYYPSSATDFSQLATKFGYSVMRDVAFSAVREFYPDIAAHYIRRHREKMAARNP